MEKKPKNLEKSVTNKRTIEDVRADFNRFQKKIEELQAKIESENNVGLPELNDFLKEYPDNYNALHKRARLKIDNDDINGAIEDFKRILEFYPCDYIALANIGIFLRDTEKYEEGLAYFNEVVLLCPKSSVAFESRAWFRSSLHDYRGAIEDYTKAFENDKRNLIVINNRGLAKIQINDFNGAIEDFTFLINSDDQSWVGESYKIRGEIRIKNGLLEEGNADLIKAKEIGYPEDLDEFIRDVFERKD